MLSDSFILEFRDADYDVFPHPEFPYSGVIFRNKKTYAIQSLKFSGTLENRPLKISQRIASLVKEHICSGKGFGNHEFRNVNELEIMLINAS